MLPLLASDELILIIFSKNKLDLRSITSLQLLSTGNANIKFQSAVVQREIAVNEYKSFYLTSQNLRGYSDPVVYFLSSPKITLDLGVGQRL